MVNIPFSNRRIFPSPTRCQTYWVISRRNSGGANEILNFCSKT